MDEIKEKLDEIKKYLINKFNCEAILLFGSYARNSQNAESDIDLAIKLQKEIQPKELFETKLQLEEIVKKDVDLIDLNNTQDGIKYEILMNGINLYVKDEMKFELYKLDMYREYLELNESRQMIIDNIKKGGKIYGKEAVILNKYEIIERCIKRINEEYESNPENLDDYRRLDCIVLNLQRACEASIDITMYIVGSRKLGVPQTKKEAFKKLEENNIITSQMSKNMQNMAGFRNIAVHDYKEIDEEILQDIIENHINDLLEFAREMLNLKR